VIGGWSITRRQWVGWSITRGQWVGEVCHIEAAMLGGERFNAAMFNEERRAKANLVLLCHDHHVETDDPDEFSVSVLRGMKADHEARFSAPPPLSEEQLERSFKTSWRSPSRT
jgi:hypothetical protein